ncbi:MAG TPA: hypothetical protein VFV94_20870 [Polyangiaceae bacterium]|nr:hypothetical protein [Polyangiaceae bacterium]
MSRLRAFGLAPALAGALLAAGCQNQGERPPPPTCVGNCGGPANISVGFPTTPGGGGESGEEPEQGGASNGETVTLEGNVQLLFDNGRFDSGEVLTDAASIKSTRADGRTATDTWNGMDAFEIDELPADTTSWLLVTPQTAGADAAATLEPVLTQHANAQGVVNADLGVVRESNIDTVFDLLSVPVQRDSRAAQVVLRLTSRSAGSGLTPLAGVTVQSSSAESISYATGGGYSDVATATDATGVAVLLNCPAGGWPGALVNIEFTGAKTGGTQVRAVTGAVSLVTIAL